MNKKVEVILKKFFGVEFGEKKFEERRIEVLKRKEVKKCGDRKSFEVGGLEYLIFSEEIFMEPGDIIVENGDEHEILEMRVYRDITGKVCAVSCITIN